MILPTKYISIRYSLLGIGAELLKSLDTPKTVTALWSIAKTLPEVKTFQRYVLALDLLFILGAIEMRRGMLTKCQ